MNCKLILSVKIIYLIPTVSTYYSQVAELPMIANTVMAQVLELLLDGSCLQSPLQFGPSKGPWVQIFERSTGSKTPLRPYMGTPPSGTRESWSWKMRRTCLAVGTTSPLERNKFTDLTNLSLF